VFFGSCLICKNVGSILTRFLHPLWLKIDAFETLKAFKSKTDSYGFIALIGCIKEYVSILNAEIAEMPYTLQTDIFCF